MKKIRLELTIRQMQDMRAALVRAVNAEHTGMKYRKLEYSIQRMLWKHKA
jgi:hypothetical protein